MFYQPELIVYLWMLPVLFMIVIPVLWTMTRILYQAVGRSWLTDCVDSLKPDSTALVTSQVKKEENRPGFVLMDQRWVLLGRSIVVGLMQLIFLITVFFSLACLKKCSRS